MVLAGCMSADDQLQQLDEEYKALSRVYKQFVSQLPDDIIPDSIRVKVEDARYTLRFVER